MQKAGDNIPRLCSMLDWNSSSTFSQSFVLCLCFLITCTYSNYRPLYGFFIVQHRKNVSHAYWRKPLEFFEWYINHPRFACKIVFFLALNGPDKLKFAFSKQVVFLSNFQIANHSVSSIFYQKFYLFVYIPACLASCSSIALTSVIAIPPFIHTLYYIILFSFWQIIPKINRIIVYFSYFF